LLTVSPTLGPTVRPRRRPLRDATPDDRDSTLPRSVRLLDLVPFDATDPAALETAWRVSPRTPASRWEWGLTVSRSWWTSRPTGPHVLVAGTTGAGKSELLQTLVAGLAVGNRPDEMSFVLIDYKGGAAFRDCAELPHTVGMVTDLDGHLTERALRSLGAELRRREAVLAGRGAPTWTSTSRSHRHRGKGWLASSLWSTSSRRWPRSCPTSWAAWWRSPNEGARSECISCSPPNGPAAS
jgi:DNA segregation ATPase FtsK/SpoIIIE-like protein